MGMKGFFEGEIIGLTGILMTEQVVVVWIRDNVQPWPFLSKNNANPILPWHLTFIVFHIER